MEMNYEKLLHNLYARVIAVDESLTITYCNHLDPAGAKVVEPVLKREIEKAFREKGSFANVKVSERKDAARVSILPETGYAAGHYAEIDGKPYVTVSIIDITHLQQQRDRLEEALEEAENASTLKSKCIQNMSHELRSPLNAIVGFANLLVETDDKEKQKKYSSLIQTNTRLILSLADDVLDLAKADSGNLKLNYKMVDINAFMKSMTDMLELKVSKNIMVNCLLSCNDMKLRTDPDRLGRVMQNLLSNAVKYTSKGHITAGYEVEGDEITFFVKDTGCGIPHEKQKYVFDRFWRGKNDGNGVGLGLPISKDIVDAMGGTIGVKSGGEGKGSTFWFTLPISGEAAEDQCSASDVTDEEMSEIRRQSGQDALAEEDGESDLPVLLIAEDNESNYLLYEAIFEDTFRIVHAWNGEEAVEMAARYNPLIILMDISMPGMDGYQATEAIRKTGSDTPIIAVTAYAFSTDKEKIMEQGFNAYISKPINVDSLLAAMEKCLQ